MNGAHTLAGDDLIFAQRMLPHVMAGKSPVEAARSVLDDDVRIFNAVFANNRRGVEAGVFSELSARVYRAAIAKATAGGA